MKAGYYVEYEVWPVNDKKVKFSLMSGELYEKTLSGLKDQMNWFENVVREKHGGASVVKYGKFFKVDKIKNPF